MLETTTSTDPIALRFFGAIASSPIAISAESLVSHPADADQLLALAADLGPTLINCGQAEHVVGAVLARNPQLRNNLSLATTNRSPDSEVPDSRFKTILGACEDRLHLLGVDVIDLFLIDGYDHYTDPADLAATLSRLRNNGKLREVGVIGYTTSQFRTLAEYLPFELVTNQVRYSADRLAPMTDGTLDLALETGTTPLAARPLSGGRLVTGDELPPSLAAVLDRLARREGVDRATIALAFVLAHPSRPVAVVSSTNPDHLEANRAATRIHLDHDDCYSILGAANDVSRP